MILDIRIFKAVKITEFHRVVNDPGYGWIVVKFLSSSWIHHSHAWDLSKDLPGVPIHKFVELFLRNTFCQIAFIFLFSCMKILLRR